MVGEVRARKTSSSVAWRRLTSVTSMPASSSARTMSTMRTSDAIGPVTVTASVSIDGSLDENPATMPAAATSSPADGSVTSMRSPPMLRLELVGRAGGDGAAVVEHDDVVGQAVGLLEVLRREDQRGALADELAQHLPEVLAAARVEARRRLVEEQHAGRGHQAGGEVEPPAHAAGERLDQPVGGVGQPEPLEQLVGPQPGGLAWGAG